MDLIAMPIAELTAAAATKIVTPILTDLFKTLKSTIQETSSKWTIDAGSRKISRHLISIDKVKTIWSPEKDISLKKFYYPSKIYSEENEYKTISEITDLPSGNLIIEGIVGQGKSIFMRYLASSVISRLSCIPIFLELRNITSGRTLGNAILAYIDMIGIKASPEVFEYLAQSAKIVILLDGFDEIPRNCVADTIYEIDNLQSKYPDLKIIISSRPGTGIQNVSGLEVVNLATISDQDYEGFLKKLVTGTVKRSELVHAISNCPENIKGVINTPLMLTLVVIVYESEKEIPSTLPEFFEKLFSIVFSKHDRLKAGFNREHHSGLSENKLQRLFECFCFMVIHEGLSRSLSDAEFTKAFDKAIKHSNVQCELETFKLDIVKVACLMLEDGIDMTTFLHKSILEYHAAAFVRKASPEFATKFYQNSNVNYHQWAPVMEFLKIIDDYRYAKDYAIAFLEKDLDILSGILLRRKNDELSAYLDSQYPGLVIGFLDGHVSSMGPIRSAPSYFKETLDWHLTHDIVGEVGMISPNTISKAAKKSKISKPTTSSSKRKLINDRRHELEKRLNIENFLEVIEPTLMWKHLAFIEHELLIEMNSFHAIMEAEKSLASLFD